MESASITQSALAKRHKQRFVSIFPPQLYFPPPLERTIQCLLILRNESDTEIVTFKLRTTSPMRYCVRPKTGILRPRSEATISISFASKKRVSLEEVQKDKFLVEFRLVDPRESDSMSASSTLWAKSSMSEVHPVSQRKLRCVFAEPPDEVATMEEREATDLDASGLLGETGDGTSLGAGAVGGKILVVRPVIALRPRGEHGVSSSRSSATPSKVETHEKNETADVKEKHGIDSSHAAPPVADASDAQEGHGSTRTQDVPERKEPPKKQETTTQPDQVPVAGGSDIGRATASSTKASSTKAETQDIDTPAERSLSRKEVLDDDEVRQKKKEKKVDDEYRPGSEIRARKPSFTSEVDELRKRLVATESEKKTLSSKLTDENKEKQELQKTMQLMKEEVEDLQKKLELSEKAAKDREAGDNAYVSDAMRISRLSKDRLFAFVVAVAIFFFALGKIL
eukprot:TRINITY_DN2294_c0_g1_i2.p1 TRINITY_DN2294_c0_g1~~TRINITY_DN2294_c0_g1_i2.p1  ORF type:complete len:488 (-),score=144.39 TRINITY_DN2294_c0_g1_i2:85-1446(-)